MYVDASAIVAILARESDASDLLVVLERSDPAQRKTSPVAVFEAVFGIARIFHCSIADARVAVYDFLEEAEIAIESVNKAHAELAILAMERFGKGRHPAALNMGDCFGYAVARAARIPILFKGDDFSRTDLRLACVAKP